MALRVYRGERTKASVARAAGIPRNKLGAYERGTTVPRRATLEKIAAALDVTLSAIEALANLLSLAPELLEGRANSEGVRALERAARLATRLSSTGAPVVPAVLEPETERPESELRTAALWSRLLPYSAAQRRAIVQENEEFHVWLLSTRLCDESLEIVVCEPAEALELARLAELIASLVPGREASRNRLRGFCVFHVCTALRALGKLPESAEALQRAETLWEAGDAGGPTELLSEARVLGLKASLRRDQRHLGESLDLLEQALTMDRGELRAQLLMNRAKVLEEMDDYQGAIATLEEALPRIDAEREPRLLWSLRFNLAENLAQVGRHAQAAPHLAEVLKEAPRFARGVLQHRLRWLQGRLAAGLGRNQEAEEALDEVRAAFAGLGIPYDTALVSLDLAKLHLQEGRTAEVRKLAAEMVKTFREQGVHREALAAVRLFQRAADQERASVELARRLADYLRRARHDEGLRFEGG
jgi:tetratricopeptide (TPR) repeat protein